MAWAADNGDDITSNEPDSTGVFFIRDDALDTPLSGTAIFSGIPANSKFFNIATGAAGPAAPGTTTGVTRILNAPGYSTSSPNTTPLTGNPTVTVGGASTLVEGFDTSAGTFTLVVAKSATTTATFGYALVNVGDGQQTVTRRARVSSTSDPAGEWITIGEVASATDSSPNATSRLFRGEVTLSSNAATQGTNNDGVWVQIGDAVVAIYYDSIESIVDADAVIVVAP